MDYMELDSYYKCIEILEAKETLAFMLLGDWPNIKQEKRREIHKRFVSKANSLIQTEQKRLTSEDLAKLLGGHG